MDVARLSRRSWESSASRLNGSEDAVEELWGSKGTRDGSHFPSTYASANLFQSYQGSCGPVSLRCCWDRFKLDTPGNQSLGNENAAELSINTRQNKPWQYVRKQISDTLEVFGLLSLVLRLDVPTSVPPSPARRRNANMRAS